LCEFVNLTGPASRTTYEFDNLTGMALRTTSLMNMTDCITFIEADIAMCEQNVQQVSEHKHYFAQSSHIN